MPLLLKLALSLTVIAGAAAVSRRFPALGGLIATMPLTSLLVLLWLYADDPRNYRLFESYTRGVLWGIIPTVLFFLAVEASLRRELPFPWVLASGFALWLAAAAIHQYFLR